MKFGRSLLLILAITGLSNVPALAGRNAGGAMVVHTSDSYNYSNQTACTTAAGDPGTCDAAVTTATRDAGQVVWLLAAFPEGTSPGVGVVYFGIEYDDTTLDPGAAYRACGPAGSLEVPDTDWPYTGRGNSVAFGSAVIDDLLFPFYVFKIDGGTDGSYFGTGVNPTGGYASFTDDNTGNPTNDLVTRFGTVRWNTAGVNQCPVLAPGACCLNDGSCTLAMPDACTTQEGVFQGLDTVCDPNPCPAPQVCCNILTSECRFLPPLVCGALGEDWEAVNLEDATSCSEEPCDKGACCKTSGECEIRQRYSCERIGGSFQGAGTVCSPDPCPKPGACCLPNGTCQSILEATCIDQEGTFRGQNVLCENLDPPCPQPDRGACCIEATCYLHTPQTCATLGGNYKGTGTDCDPDPCVGACCIEGSAQCIIRSAANCGGTYMGDGTDCDPDPCGYACCKRDGTCEMITTADCGTARGQVFKGARCSANPSPCADFFACCKLDGTCQMMTAADCEDVFGLFNEGLYCEPADPCGALEACCFETGECQLLTPEVCTNLGGTTSPDVVCEPNGCPQPPPGACCKPDGTCEEMPQWQCDRIDDAVFRGAETTCLPDSCEDAYACCFEDGTCEILWASICVQRGGTSLSPIAICNPNPCPIACCLTNGTCELLSRAACEDRDGTPKDGITYCDPFPCPGACCDPDYGTCRSAGNEQACTSTHGIFLEGAVCEPNPCPPPILGACCYIDGVCEMLPAGLCTAARGTYLGADVPCDPYPCRGACCPGDETCVMGTRAECAVLQGLYLGDGTTCGAQNNICKYSPTEETSWGRIRALFR